MRFSRALRQRNASLKLGMDPQTWDGEVVTNGERVADQRSQWFETIKPYLKETIHRLSGLGRRGDLSPGLASGSLLRGGTRRWLGWGTAHGAAHWQDPSAQTFNSASGEGSARKSLARPTEVGRLRHGVGVVAPPAARWWRTTNTLAGRSGRRVGRRKLTRLVDLVSELNCQLIVTSLDPALYAFRSPRAMFHVEQGTVQRL